MQNNVDIVLSGLMRRYQERVPDVERILSQMVMRQIISRPDDIENDHIAFRTMGVPQLGIQSLEKIFLSLGFEKKDYYNFPEKKLNAFWYAPPNPRLPRIFVSELRVAELSAAAQKIILKYTDEVSSDPVLSIELSDPQAIDTFLHSPLWSTPTWAEYQQLQKESEYAAWVIFNRYYLNHFTISLQGLRDGFNTVANFNTFLESIGIKLNDAGGKIKQSPDGLLLQSSTVAEMIDAEFAGDVAGQRHSIPGSYVEFAERRVLPEFANLPADQIERKHRRDGFEAQNANKIFESTYSAQTTRKD